MPLGEGQEHSGENPFRGIISDQDFSAMLKIDEWFTGREVRLFSVGPGWGYLQFGRIQMHFRGLTEVMKKQTMQGQPLNVLAIHYSGWGVQGDEGRGWHNYNLPEPKKDE